MTFSANPGRAGEGLPRLKRGARRFFTCAMACALPLAFAPGAMACAACFGKSDSRLAAAMNWGIFSLMLVIVGVLGGIACCAVSLARRAAAHAASETAAQTRANSVESVEMEMENS